MAADGTVRISTILDNQTLTNDMSKLGGVIKKGAAGMAAAIGAAGAAFTGLMVKSLDLAGGLEQNLGGAEAVFGKFASKVEEKGKSAFSSMGLSMSDFLATANKMGALFQGAGFGIEESADLSTQAMQRAADVASIMGIEVGAAMEAVAGAAKGNFTMMDNLGVAMNAAAIEAYAMSKGIETSYAAMDNQTKIGLAMEMFLEKTAYAAGNYAKENETLAGSLSTAKAALENFLSGAGDADAVADSFSHAADIILKNVVELAPRLAEGIGEIINKLAPQIPDIMEELLPVIISGAAKLLDGLINALPEMTDVLIDVIPMIIDAIFKLSGKLFDAGKEVVRTIFDGIEAELPIIGGALKGLSEILITVADAFNVIGPPVIAATLALKTYLAMQGAIVGVLAARIPVENLVNAAMANRNTALLLCNALERKGLELDGAKIVSKTTGAAISEVETRAILKESGALTLNTAATAAHAGGTGILSVAKMGLSGVLKVVTVGWKTLTAAMLANPVGAIIVGVVALTAAVAALILIFKKESDGLYQARMEAEKTTQANEELVNSVRSANKAYSDKLKSYQAEAQAAKSLADKIYELSAAAGEDASKKAEVKRYVDMLNESMEGLNLQYDEENNQLSMTKEALNEVIAARLKQLEVQAMEERYVDLLKRRYDLEQQVKQSNEDFNKLIAEGALETKKGRDAVDALLIKDGELNKELMSLNSELGTLETTMGEVTIQTQNASGAAEDSAESFEEQQRAVEDAAKAHKDYVDSIVNGLEYITLSAEKSFDDIVDIVLSNEQALQNWSDNLAVIAESGFGEFASILEEQGVEATGYAVAEMAEQIRELESKSGQSVLDMINNFRAFPSAYDEVLSETELVTLAGMSNIQAAILGEQEKFEALGLGTSYKMLKGFKEGLIDLPPAAVAGMEAAIKAGEAKLAAMKPTFESILSDQKTRQDLADLEKTRKETEKSAEQAAKNAEQIAKDGFEKESKLIEKRIEQNKLSTAASIAEWKKLGEKYKAYADLREKADENAAKAFKKYQSEQFDVYADMIDKKKKEADTSFQWEIRQYKLLAEKYADNAELKAKADEKLKSIQEDVLKKQADLLERIKSKELEYKNAVRDRTNEILNATKVSAKLYASEAERSEAIKASKDKISELKGKEEELLKTRSDFNATADERMQAEKELSGIREEITKAKKEQAEAEKTNGQRLTESRKEQLKNLKDWINNRNKLLNSGVDENALAELSREEISAMAGMTGSELAEYNKLWKQSQKIAKDAALDELKDLKAQTASEIKDLKKELKDTLSALETDNYAIGINTVQGLINGMESMEYKLAATTRGIAETMLKAMKKALRINSPSGEAMDIMGYYGDGFLVKGQRMLPEFGKMSSRMADALGVDLASTKFGFDTSRLLMPQTSFDGHNPGDTYTYNINSMALNERDVIRIIKDYDRRRRWVS